MVKEIIDELYECKRFLETGDPLSTEWENKISDCYHAIKSK